MVFLNLKKAIVFFIIYKLFSPNTHIYINVSLEFILSGLRHRELENIIRYIIGFDSCLALTRALTTAGLISRKKSIEPLYASLEEIGRD